MALFSSPLVAFILYDRTFPPTAPIIENLVVGDGVVAVHFSWSAWRSVNQFVCISKPDQNIVKGVTSPLNFTALRNGISYTFTLTAINHVGASPPVESAIAVMPSSYLIYSLAGSLLGYADDTNGLDAKFHAPYGMAYDEVNGILYVADYGNDRIRMVVGDGSTSTLCGGSSSGFTDGDFHSAQFTSPVGIAYNEQKMVLYVSDANHAIRKIDLKQQMVHTLAGSGQDGCADGIGTKASFSSPFGVCYAPSLNVLFVADSRNHRVRAVNVESGSVSTYAGSTAGDADGMRLNAKFNTPYDVTFDAVTGILYVADRMNHKIKAINTHDNTVVTLQLRERSVSLEEKKAYSEQKDEDEEQFSIRSPYAIELVRYDSPSSSPSFSSSSSQVSLAYLYVTDQGNDRIRRIDLSDLSVETLAGAESFATVDADLEEDDDDEHTKSAVQINDGKKKSKEKIRKPARVEANDICVDSAGTIFLSETKKNRIRKIVPLNRKHTP